MRNDIKSNTALFRQLLEKYIQSNNSSLAADMVFIAAKEDMSATYFLLLDENGNILFERGNSKNINIPELLAHPVTSISFWQLMQGKPFTVAYEIQLSNGKKITSVANSNYPIVNSILLINLVEMVLLIIPFAMFFILGSRNLQKKLNLIIASTTEKAQAIANGNYNLRLTYDQPNEFSAIADSFNTMAKKIQENIAALSAFSGNVAHEIRNPLSGIELASKMIVLHNEDTTATKKLAGRIAVETQRMEKLVQTLLALAKLDGQELQRSLNFNEIHIAEVVTEILAERHAEICRKNLLVNTIIDSHLLLCSDAILFHQLLDNLIGNAVKFSSDSDEINVNCSSGEDGGIVIIVADSGPGISAADLPHIFERFFRSDTTQNAPGNGLGLAIVKKITDLLGGEIAVTSNLGAGTAFCIKFPRNTADTASR